ncbi:unnamed protein product [Zymoseptoria tritici ST99CH_1A5]|uniref:Uncharacterized protein n=1 Tax=Zymoseptoria tritici ST99CH_1A5 TaxID=1276529 RepID=A0A1Y6LMV2_ZYMTR|nr:unnamed protein product [Zymoseptoria tritici ST99CH_1A5]
MHTAPIAEVHAVLKGFNASTTSAKRHATMAEPGASRPLMFCCQGRRLRRARTRDDACCGIRGGGGKHCSGWGWIVDILPPRAARGV